MIKVCDAIMGSGKSQSAIAYMNAHRDRNFVYITPYLDEAKRIKENCPELMFVEPSNKLPQFKFSKLEHTKHLLTEGCNIATTHSAFRSYTRDMIEYIKKYNYTLIVDEAVDVFQEAKYSSGDIQLLVDGGFAERMDDDIIVCTEKVYTGRKLREFIEMLQCNNLVQADPASKRVQYYYWTLPCEILCAFSDVFILTYLFEAQELKYFLDMNNLEYSYIGIHREGDKYEFADTVDYIPSYVHDLQKQIHIFDNQKLNSIGESKHSLSANWMKTKEEERRILKNHLYNFVRNYNNCTCNDVLWSTYNGSVNALRGRGFSRQNIEFNKKATNDYRDRTVLAYCVNIFASPQKVNFFAKHGIEYNSDGYALSTMIQWIWRSAIRDGKEIHIYIPSKRMRELLTNWIKEVSECE